MKIKWLMNNGLCGCDQTGEIEVADNASEEDIEAAVKEDMWDVVSLSWERVWPMKLLAPLALAISLMSAGPADARHHHRGYQAQHNAVPVPRERPRPHIETIWLVSAGSPQDRINQAFLVLGWR